MIFISGLNEATLTASPLTVVTVIGPLCASGGTTATIEVAVCTPSVAAPGLPLKCTTGEAPKPVPVIVTFAPPTAARGENETSFGSTLKGVVVFVVPPAFVTAIGPSTAAFGTVTFNDVPPTPTVNTAATVPLNFTLDVPVNVFPESTM